MLPGKIINRIALSVTKTLAATAVTRFPKAFTRKGARNIPIPEAVPIARDSTD